jgi:hypothetical protein
MTKRKTPAPVSQEHDPSRSLPIGVFFQLDNFLGWELRVLIGGEEARACSKLG